MSAPWLLQADDEILRLLHLRPQDHGALLLGLFFCIGIPAGALVPSFFRRVHSVPVGVLLLFGGGALASNFVEGSLAVEFGRDFALTFVCALGAMSCLLLVIVPARLHANRKDNFAYETSPTGGPTDSGASGDGSWSPVLLASASPRPRLRSNHGGLLAALLAPWSLLLWSLSLQFGLILLGTESGVTFEKRLLLSSVAFTCLAVGAVFVPAFLQSDARGASGLLLLQGAASLWLAKAGTLLSWSTDVGLWSKLESWGMRPEWTGPLQALLILFPVLSVAGAGLPVLASGLIRDEAGWRTGGLLGWASIGSLAWFGLLRMQATEALALVVSLAMLGVLLLEVTPSGGVGRVRNRAVRFLGSLGRLTTVLLLGGLALVLARVSAPQAALLKLRAGELCGLEDGLLSSWRHEGLRVQAIFGQPLGRNTVTWTPGGSSALSRFSSTSEGPSGSFLLAAGLCAEPRNIASLGHGAGPESDLVNPIFGARSRWSGRGLWPWSRQEEDRAFDLIWIGELRPSSPDSVSDSTQEALALMAAQLAPGGIVAASLDLGSVSRKVLDAQLDTFSASFAWSAAWLVDGVLCLTGGPQRPVSLTQLSTFGPPESWSAARTSLGLDTEAMVLGRFVGELGQSASAPLTDSSIATLFSPEQGPRLLARNLGGVYARATPAPAIWDVRESAVGRLAVQGFRALGKVRIAKAWVDHYRETAPMSIAQGTWEERLGRALLEAKSLLHEEGEIRLFEDRIRAEDWRAQGLFALREGSPARAVGPFLQASVTYPERADLQLLLAAALELAGNRLASEAAQRRVRELSPSWAESSLARELMGLGYPPVN